MHVLILGATGMVGQGVLRECLLDDGVKRVVTLGRSAIETRHPKLRQIVHADLLDLTAIEGELTALDACFYCLGASAAGITEQEYVRVNHDITLAVAETLVRLDPGMTFIYVSGAGTDSSEHGRVMWARVKGRTENALLRLPFQSAYMLRPAVILPMHGIKSRTMLYRVFYTLVAPAYPLLKRLPAKYVTTSERLGRAMLRLARTGYSSRVLASADIDLLGERPVVGVAPPQ
ncbi:MAG: NAD-dependent epimerase/dehydratase family protein [Gemmatimonadaceae bacterium]